MASWPQQGLSHTGVSFKPGRPGLHDTSACMLRLGSVCRLMVESALDMHGKCSSEHIPAGVQRSFLDLIAVTDGVQGRTQGLQHRLTAERQRYIGMKQKSRVVYKPFPRCSSSCSKAER